MYTNVYKCIHLNTNVYKCIFSLIISIAYTYVCIPEYIKYIILLSGIISKNYKYIPRIKYVYMHCCIQMYTLEYKCIQMYTNV